MNPTLSIDGVPYEVIATVHAEEHTILTLKSAPNEVTTPDPIDAAIEAARQQLATTWQACEVGHVRDDGLDAADIAEIAEAAIRAAAPILIAAGREEKEREVRAWMRELGKVNPWLLADGREAAARDIEADPGIPIFFNRGNEEQHEDPVLLRSVAAAIARGGDV